MKESKGPRKQGRNAVANTRHGDDYQVHLAMYWSFHYVYIDPKEDLGVQIENPGFGKFDDIIIQFENRVIAIQVKHRLEEKNLATSSDFTTSGSDKKKLALYKYFDSVFDKLSSNEHEDIEFWFMSNQSLDSIVASYIDPEGKLKRKSKFKTDLINSIRENSTSLKKASQYKEKDKEVINFLTRVKFLFGQPKKSELAENIKNEIKKQFHTENESIYNACFREFYKYFISRKEKTITYDGIIDFFERCIHKFIYLERLWGLTQQKLKNIENKDPNSSQIKVLKSLSDYQAGKKNILFLHGKAGIGKSTLMKQFFSSKNYNDGEYLFLDVKDFYEPTLTLKLKYLEPLKILAIDNAELLLTQSEQRKGILLIAHAAKVNNKKLIFLVREDSYEPLERYFLEYSSVNLALESFTSEEVKKLIAPFVELNLPAFYKLLEIPFYLNIALRHLECLKENQEIFVASENEIQDYLIKLAIKRPGISKDTFNLMKLSKQRIKILRRITFLMSQSKPLASLFKTESHQKLLNELISDGILIGNKDQTIDFSHLLFEEWVVKNIASKYLLDYIETGDDIEVGILPTLRTRLPKHSYVWLNVLIENQDFKEALFEKLSKISRDSKKIGKISDLSKIETLTFAIEAAIASGFPNTLFFLLERINLLRREKLERIDLDYPNYILSAVKNNHTETAMLLLDDWEAWGRGESKLKASLLAAVIVENLILVKALLKKYILDLQVLCYSLETIVRKGYPKISFQRYPGNSETLQTPETVFARNLEIKSEIITILMEALVQRIEFEFDVQRINHQCWKTELSRIIEDLLKIAIKNDDAPMVTTLLHQCKDFKISRKFQWNEFFEDPDEKPNLFELAIKRSLKYHKIDILIILLQRVSEIEILEKVFEFKLKKGDCTLTLGGLLNSSNFVGNEYINIDSPIFVTFKGYFTLEHSLREHLLNRAGSLYKENNKGLASYLKIIILAKSYPLLDSFLNQNLISDFNENILKEILIFAIKKASLEGVQILLRVGVDINFDYNDFDRESDTHQSYSPLLIATKLGNLKIMQFLLEKGAKLKGLGEVEIEVDGRSIVYCKTPLEIAVIKDDLAALGLLLEYKGNAIEEAEWQKTLRESLQFAIERNRIKSVQLLLKAGADVNGGYCSDFSDKKFSFFAPSTPLFIATRLGYTNIMRLLLEKGANTRFINGSTPLHIAAANNDLEASKLLLEYEANPKALDKFEKAPYQLASDVQLIELLTPKQEKLIVSVEGNQKLIQS